MSHDRAKGAAACWRDGSGLQTPTPPGFRFEGHRVGASTQAQEHDLDDVFDDLASLDDLALLTVLLAATVVYVGIVIWLVVPR